jgi:hypothetical protein
MFENGSDFENEVRRIARALWPSAEHSGAAIEDGRERDGVFHTEDVIHLVECTMQRAKDKTEKDIRKLSQLARSYRASGKAVKCWFVTLEEPTAEQRQVVDKARRDNIVIEILSYAQFRDKTINSLDYLSLRFQYRFGSMEEKWNDDFHYTSMDIVSSNGQTHSVDQLSRLLAEGQVLVFLGDYGAGKSTTMREIFINLSKLYRKHEILQFPVHLNLRDHYGQSDPVEALERHARNIGFANPSHLVRAWRARRVILLLDGFDEIASPGWTGDASKLRDLRRKSMTLIRKFIEDSEDGIAIAGRGNYFDSDEEMRSAFFSTSSRSPFVLKLNDFTAEQVKEYLERRRWDKEIPDWFPTRPLLLGYLAKKGLLPRGHVSPAEGWHMLLNDICAREARIDVNLDGQVIRKLIERLASRARKDDGTGPLSSEIILSTFTEVCGRAPDDQGLVLIQRLPGLGEPDPQNGSRKFIDVALADAAKAGDAVEYIKYPYVGNQFDHLFKSWERTAGSLCHQVAAFLCSDVKPSQLAVAVQRAVESEYYVLATDILQIAQQMEVSLPLRGRMTIKNSYITDFSFEHEMDLSSLTFQDCIFTRLTLPPDVTHSTLPKFNSCLFATVDGRSSERDMPSQFFVRCDFESFTEDTTTNNRILSLNIPEGCRVLLTVLRKLYMQRGSARKPSAFVRGIDQRLRDKVAPILQLLKREGFAIEHKAGNQTSWIPVRKNSREVSSLIESPAEHINHPLMRKAAEI